MRVQRTVAGAQAALRRSREFWSSLSRSKRGAIAVFVASAIPIMIMIGGLSVDQNYVNMRTSMLRGTAQAAALAGGQYLSTYYTTGNSSQITTAATTIAASNMPTARYGTVVPTSNVVLGTWASGAFTATTTNPTAVKVTALSTSGNNNPIKTFFGAAFGKPTVDVSTSAVASYGTAAGQPFNTIIVNDLSMSFSSEIANQRKADIAILNCVANASSSTSQVGLTAFTGVSLAIYSLGNAVTNLSAMTTYINNTLNYCGNSHMPACSGSNVAAGLYSAITQLQAASIATTNSNIIVITDGVPNADARTYVKADGTYPTPTSSTPVCTTRCTDANLWTMAQNQSAYAKTLGINISTVYYSGDTTGSSTITDYSNKLASLVTGSGIALVAPSAAKIDSAFGAFCASMGSQLKMVN